MALTLFVMTTSLASLALDERYARFSAKLREMIDREMLESVLGDRKFGRVRRAQEGPSRQAIKSRWSAPVDLRKFAPCPRRPSTTDGRTSFHFGVETVKSSARAGATHGNTGGASRASDFEAYLHDEKQHAGGAVRELERYLIDAKDGARRDAHHGRAELIVSTIGRIVDERAEFWRERERRAKKPRPAALILRPACGSVEAWAGLSRDPNLPKLVRDAVRQIGLDLEEGIHVKKTVEVLIGDADTSQWAESLKDRFGSRASDRMVHYREPRAARLQERYEFELPAELTREDRADIVETFARILNNRKPIDEPGGAAFTIVVHAPDPSNNIANYHAHLLRAPAIYARDGDGRFDFERKREMRPGELARVVEPGIEKWLARSTVREKVDEDVLALRRCVAKLCNERLEARGHERRLDPRRYAEMGIEQEPQVHLSSAAAALVAAGAQVTLDNQNAVKSWRGENQRRVRAIEAEAESHKAALAPLRSALASSATAGDAARQAQAALQEMDELSAAILQTAERIGELNMLQQIAVSAAERLEQSTARLIDQFSPDRGLTPARHREQRLIRARHALAERHCDEVAAVVAPYREAIFQAREWLEAARERFVYLEEDACRLAAGLARDQATEWWQTTVLERSGDQPPLLPHQHVAALIDHLQSQASLGNAEDRFLFAERNRESGGATLYGLKKADEELLQSEPLKRRLMAQVEHSTTIQEREIGRLTRAIEVHGLSAIIAGGPDPYLKTLYRRYLKHPSYRRAEGRALAKFSRTVKSERSVEPLEARHDLSATSLAMSVDPPIAIASAPLSPPAKDSEIVTNANRYFTALRHAQRGGIAARQSRVDHAPHLHESRNLDSVRGLSTGHVVHGGARAEMLVPSDPSPDLARKRRPAGDSLRRARTPDRGNALPDVAARRRPEEARSDANASTALENKSPTSDIAASRGARNDRVLTEASSLRATDSVDTHANRRRMSPPTLDTKEVDHVGQQKHLPSGEAKAAKKHAVGETNDSGALPDRIDGSGAPGRDANVPPSPIAPNEEAVVENAGVPAPSRNRLANPTEFLRQRLDSRPVKPTPTVSVAGSRRSRSAKQSVSSAGGSSTVHPSGNVRKQSGAMPEGGFRALIDRHVLEAKDRMGYANLPRHEREAVDQIIQAPINFIKDGLAAVRLNGDELELTLRPQDHGFLQQLLEQPFGEGLLREIALSPERTSVLEVASSWLTLTDLMVDVAGARLDRDDWGR